MTLANRTDVQLSPHNPQPKPKTGMHLVYKPVVSEMPSDDPVVAAQSTQLNTGGLPLTLRPDAGARQEAGVHNRSTNRCDRASRDSIHPHSSHVPAPRGHVDTPHELRNALATARTLCNQLEIADMLPEMRTALWLREQILVRLLEVEGFVEVTES